ncbi:hypothetical protein B566_EDAN002822 [Ephemera danica]|nr:hypothetical protein B566_EDAN002822 [Ephemera danica]
MADDSGNEDSWLYGDSNQEPPTENIETVSKVISETEESKVDTSNADVPTPALVDNNEQNSLPKKPSDSWFHYAESGEAAEIDKEVAAAENGEQNEDDDDEDDDSDDDDVQVTIGDIKTAPTYTPINLKRGLAADKSKVHTFCGSNSCKGKFSIEEFEAVGTINGVAAHEFNLDSLEDKPWRKPGADITDYFNYGFNEDTWRAYCERQKRIRIHDSGVGLMSLGGPTKVNLQPGSIPVTIINDNSKYSGMGGPKKAGPPPGRKLAGTIDVIGGNPGSSRRSLDSKAGATAGTPTPETQENPIQVMTADRREYGRPKTSFPDLSVPPPAMPPFDMPPPNIDTIPPFTGAGSYNNSEFYPPEADQYYQSYEPTADLQWGQQPWEGGGGVVAPSNVVIPLGGDSDRKSREGRDGRESRERRDSSTGDKEETNSEKDRSERHREK